MLKKEYIVILATIGVAIWTLVNLLGTSAFCGNASLSTCRDVVFVAMFSGTIFLPFFAFSLITYFLREQTYRSWLRFTLGWVPLSFLVVLLANDRPNFFFPSDQEMIGLVMWASYVLISAGIILIKSLRR